MGVCEMHKFYISEDKISWDPVNDHYDFVVQYTTEIGG